MPALVLPAQALISLFESYFEAFSIFLLAILIVFLDCCQYEIILFSKITKNSLNILWKHSFANEVNNDDDLKFA